MDPRKDRLLELLLVRGLTVTEESAFELADGTRSRWFIDCSALNDSDEARTLVGALLYETAKSLGIQAFAASGNLPEAFARATEAHSAGRSRPVTFVELGAASPGAQAIPGGAPVAIIDDVLATGVTSAAVLAQARGLGLNVTHILAVVDREEGAAARVEGLGVQIHAMVTAAELHARRKAAQRHANEAGLGNP